MYFSQQVTQEDYGYWRKQTKSSRDQNKHGSDTDRPDHWTYY